MLVLSPPSASAGCLDEHKVPQDGAETAFRRWCSSCRPEGIVPGLRKALANAGMSSYIAAVEAWCDSKGAACMRELQEGLDRNCQDLQLTHRERDQLQKALTCLLPPLSASRSTQPALSALNRAPRLPCLLGLSAFPSYSEFSLSSQVSNVSNMVSSGLLSQVSTISMSPLAARDSMVSSGFSPQVAANSMVSSGLLWSPQPQLADRDSMVSSGLLLSQVASNSLRPGGKFMPSGVSRGRSLESGVSLGIVETFPIPEEQELVSLEAFLDEDPESSEQLRSLESFIGAKLPHLGGARQASWRPAPIAAVTKSGPIVAVTIGICLGSAYFCPPLAVAAAGVSAAALCVQARRNTDQPEETVATPPVGMRRR